jgi:hypothetical protein
MDNYIEQTKLNNLFIVIENCPDIYAKNINYEL